MSFDSNKSGKILLYAFKNNISAHVAYNIKPADTIILDTKNKTTVESEIVNLLELIKNSNYKYIIGIGTYTSTTDLRIELSAKNKFRNSVINNLKDSKHRLGISQFLASQDNLEKVVFGRKMGNSFCNLSSYKIREFIELHNLNCQNGFIHVPNIVSRKDSYRNTVQNIVYKLT